MAAPALHSLIISDREDVAHILEFLFHKRVDLRKLDFRWLPEESTDLLANIVALYPDLEGLSLESCSSLSQPHYCFISHLKKLSELNFLDCEVDYVYVKLLETHVFIREHM